MDERVSVSNSDAYRLFQAFQGATAAIKKCETGLQLWRFFETPSWKSLINNCDIIDNILDKNIKEVKDLLTSTRKETLNAVDRKDIPILESLLIQNKLCMEEILTVFLDMILIGVNAVIGFVFFCFCLF